MNREKHLNKADRKKKSCLNDSVYHNTDHGCAVDMYNQRTSAVDVNNTEVKARPWSQHKRPDPSGYDGYSLTRLNSVPLNTEADSTSERDLLPFRHEAGCGSSEVYQGRLVSNNDGCHGCQKFGNRKNKKRKTFSPDFDQTTCAVVPASTADGAAGFVDRHLRSNDHSAGWQDYTDLWYSQPNTSQDEPLYNEDHQPPAIPVAVSLLASEKVSFYTLSLITEVDVCILIAGFSSVQRYVIVQKSLPHPTVIKVKLKCTWQFYV